MSGRLINSINYKNKWCVMRIKRNIVLCFVLMPFLGACAGVGVKQHTGAIPPESGYAKINDVSRYPLAGPAGQKHYQSYLNASAPKALAISESGSALFSSDNGDAVQRSLSGCKKYSLSAQCQLYAVDDKVVYKPNRILPEGEGVKFKLSHSASSPAETQFAKVDDFQRFPVQSKEILDYYKEYIKEEAPKAFALSRTGVAYYMSENSDAASLALSLCTKSSPVIPCQLYAVDNKVVYTPKSAGKGKVEVEFYASIENGWTEKIRDKWLPKIKQMATDFNNTTRKLFDVELTDNVHIYVVTNDYDYKNILIEKMRFQKESVADAAWLSAGMANGNGQIATAFSQSFSYLGRDAFVLSVKITAHELIHQLQYQLAKFSHFDAPRWLMEGSANLYAYSIVDSLGLDGAIEITREKWIEDSKYAYIANGRKVPLSDLLKVESSKDWSALMAGNKSIYETSEADSKSKCNCQLVNQFNDLPLNT